MKRKFIKIAVATAVLLLAFALCSCAGQSAEPGEVIATVSGEQVTVSAAFTEQVQNARAGLTVYLFDLEPGESVYDLKSFEPIAQAQMAQSVSFSIPLYDEGASRLTSGFALATYDSVKQTYSLLHDCPVYISNPEQLAKNTADRPNFSSIKGFNAESTAYVISLGASHSVVDLPIEDYLLSQGAADAIRQDFGGSSYYFDRSAVEALDDKILTLSNAGVALYLRVYLGSAYEELDDTQKFLSYPDTEEGSEYYQINFGSSEALASYSAFVDLLCSRYTRSDALYGFAGSIIVGKAANSPDLGAEGGDITSGLYTSEYASALRISNNILRSYYKNGQVYLAIDHRLTLKKAEGLMSADEFLAAVAAVSEDQGNYDWGVAAECASSIAGSDSVWYDTENYSLLSPTNLSALTDEILERDELVYEDVVRPVIISDFSVSSLANSLASESNQAASYAYTYYEAVKNGKIQALVYSTLNDTEGNTSGILNAAGEKQICSIIRKADTESDIADSVGETIGTVWTKLYKNEELVDKVQRGKYSFGTGKLGSSEGYEVSPIFSFDDGTLMGFDTIGGGYAGLIRDKGVSRLIAHLDTATADEPLGIAACKVAPDLIGGDYLMIPVKITPDGDVAVGNYELRLALLQNDADGEIRIYTSSVSVSPNTEATAIFDISEFTKDKLGENITVLLSVDTATDHAFTLSVDEILSATETSNVWLIVILVIVGILVLGALVVVFVLWFRKNYTVDFGSKKKAKNDQKDN